MLGQKIGQYELIDVIGAGGMATVYRAEQKSIGRIVAVKVIHSNMLRRPDAKQRFQREAHLIARLEHIHILPIYDYDGLHDPPYIVMRYLDGGTLKDVLSQGMLPLSEVSYLMHQMCTAINYANGQGVMHRDLKPSNILIDREGNSFVADFGIARLAVPTQKEPQITQTGIAIGTPQYMSPEQARAADNIDHRTDVYSLGIMLFQMITGQVPFQGATPIEVITKHLNEPVPSPLTIRPELPPKIEHVVHQALAKDPNDRYQSAMSLLEAVEEVIDKEDTNPKPAALSHAVNNSIVQRTEQKTPSIDTTPSVSRPKNEEILLKRVKDFWVSGILANSLHNLALIELDKEVKTDAVYYPWETVIQTPEKESYVLSHDKEIIDVYNESRGELLILGSPGSGKTTMLLEIARKVIRQAEQDNEQPIPVIFNLSSWENNNPIQEWILYELNKKYLIPKRIGKSWIDEDKLLLLLDGLDEVNKKYRTACINAINEFREKQFAHIVICSRTEEYEELTNKLNLKMAIILRPLTLNAVDEYLTNSGSDFDGLRELIQEDKSFKRLVTSPLWLNILTLTYRNLPWETISQSNESLRKVILDTYINKMLQRRGIDKQHSNKQTVALLKWHASNMKDHWQTLFLLESLQPSWLHTNMQRWVYTLISRTGFGLILGLMFGLVTYPFAVSTLSPAFFAIMSFSILGTLGGCIIGIIDGVRYIRPRRANKSNIRTTIDAAIYILIVAFIGVLVGGLFGWAIGWPVGELSHYVTGWQARLINEGVLIDFPLGTVTNGLLNKQLGLFLGALFGCLSFVFIFGLRNYKRSMTSDIQLVIGTGWSLKHALRGILAGIILGLILVASLGQGFGLKAGLLLCLAVILLTGYRARVQDVDSSTQQGLILSAQNVVRAGLTVGLIVGLGAWLFIGPNLGYISGIMAGILATLWFGGADIISHFILRLLLRFDANIPFNYLSFLNYATDCIILRKVGRGYIFVHRILLEYFVELEESPA